VQFLQAQVTKEVIAKLKHRCLDQCACTICRKIFCCEISAVIVSSPGVIDCRFLYLDDSVLLAGRNIRGGFGADKILSAGCS
jgi:hypothetical protein